MTATMVSLSTLSLSTLSVNSIVPQWKLLFKHRRDEKWGDKWGVRATCQGVEGMAFPLKTAPQRRLIVQEGFRIGYKC